MTSEHHEVIGLVEYGGRWYVEVTMPDYYSESSDIDFHSYPLGIVAFEWSPNEIRLGIPIDKDYYDDRYPYDEFGGI